MGGGRDHYGMDCVVCNKTGAIYRLVDGRTEGVCEQCVAEYLTSDVDNDTCLYCDAAADFDLHEYTGPVAAGAEGSSEHFELVTEGVVCRQHLEDLIGEGA
ncbi:MAG: hypothetical protein ABEJ88_01765 [Halobacterium sp.]